MYRRDIKESLSVILHSITILYHWEVSDQFDVGFCVSVLSGGYALIADWGI